MNLNLNAKTWQSAITSAGLVVGGALTWAGLTNEASVAEIIQQGVNTAPAIVTSISGLMSLGLMIYKACQHTDAVVVQTASLVQGVARDASGAAIKIAPDAPPALLALAADRSVPTVKPELPAQSLYATQRRP